MRFPGRPIRSCHRMFSGTLPDCDQQFCWQKLQIQMQTPSSFAEAIIGLFNNITNIAESCLLYYIHGISTHSKLFLAILLQQ